MAITPHPYKNLPPKSFWRTAISQRHFSEIDEIAAPIQITQSDRIATAGSCFAQHIGRNLRESGANYLDLEPAPSFLSGEEAKRHGYALYTCRYGNIYTTRQLRQLVETAMGQRETESLVWERGGRFFDALRPSVDPGGHGDPADIVKLRAQHISKVREMLETLDVFVFTLGLTECWLRRSDDLALPTAPGTIAGDFDPDAYYFQNFRYPEIYEDLSWVREQLKSFNPNARMILTVSPVPLVATASGDHVLAATTYSKSTLRAVAGDLARDFDDVFYFPSYELIATHPMRGAFFNPDLRTVNDFGVNFVMKTFFSSTGLSWAAGTDETEDDTGVICDEERLDPNLKAG